MLVGHAQRQQICLSNAPIEQRRAAQDVGASTHLAQTLAGNQSDGSRAWQKLTRPAGRLHCPPASPAALNRSSRRHGGLLGFLDGLPTLPVHLEGSIVEVVEGFGVSPRLSPHSWSRRTQSGRARNDLGIRSRSSAPPAGSFSLSRSGDYALPAAKGTLARHSLTRLRLPFFRLEPPCLPAVLVSRQTPSPFCLFPAPDKTDEVCYLRRTGAQDSVFPDDRVLPEWMRRVASMKRDDQRAR